MVGFAQAYPESLLAKLADGAAEAEDGVKVEKLNGQPATIKIDRNPTVFALVLQLFDKPAYLEADQTLATTLHKELDFYGLPAPSCTMLPAATLADMCSRGAEVVVSSIVDQMAVLTMERASDNERVALGSRITFLLTKPTARWSEAKVRLYETWTPEDKRVVEPLPLILHQALETRLRSLGYAVKMEYTQFVDRNQYEVSTTRITVSWLTAVAAKNAGRAR